MDFLRFKRKQKKTMSRNPTVDFLKGISILMVVITHYDWTGTQRRIPIFPFVINMAVPTFMIISGYVGALSFRRNHVETFSDAYSLNIILPKFIRYTIPFVLIVIWQIVDSNIALPDGFLNLLRWILNGASGPGSYYYPLLIQLLFTFPVLFFVIEKNGKKGLWLCLLFNAVYEFLKWAYWVNDECYRLLLFRYLFLIGAGIYASKYDLNRIETVLLTVFGGIFIGLLVYKNYQPMIINQGWAPTSFISVMWIVPTISYLLRNTQIVFSPINLIGRASYNIFLLQMIYYTAYRNKISFGLWWADLIAGVVICVFMGLIFYSVESKLTKILTKQVKKCLIPKV